MNVLVACEESQEVCKAFRAKGHNAFSCDIQECSGGRPEWHILFDVSYLLNTNCIQFGHGETKATCLWLKGLPELKPTNIVNGRNQRIWKMPPGPNRQKERSKTFTGIAKAMAEQWG